MTDDSIIYAPTPMIFQKSLIPPVLIPTYALCRNPQAPRGKRSQTKPQHDGLMDRLIWVAEEEQKY
jgi:hypothetical protein